MNKLIEQFMNADKEVLVGINYQYNQNSLSRLEALLKIDCGYYSFYFNNDLICDGEIYTDKDIKDYVSMSPSEAYNILKDYSDMINIRNKILSEMNNHFKNVKIDINTSIGLINLVD
jgi:hypothetical protein